MPHFMLGIDLCNRTYKVEEIPSDVIMKYVGAWGWVLTIFTSSSFKERPRVPRPEWAGPGICHKRPGRLSPWLWDPRKNRDPRRDKAASGGERCVCQERCDKPHSPRLHSCLLVCTPNGGPGTPARTGFSPYMRSLDPFPFLNA